MYNSFYMMTDNGTRRALLAPSAHRMLPSSQYLVCMREINCQSVRETMLSRLLPNFALSVLLVAVFGDLLQLLHLFLGVKESQGIYYCSNMFWPLVELEKMH